MLRHRHETGKSRILALEGGFHGRTIGALSLTHKPAFREPFGDLIDGIEFLPFNDADALEHRFDDDVAGIVLEPIQGEASSRSRRSTCCAHASSPTSTRRSWCSTRSRPGSAAPGNGSASKG
ncbi:aminotransferase class III-fold pyridoxal phosphate-dependent enzyme [Nesterenkonia pannonica]|uniref:aminotransferase class III-fold pyridoxal phosphate-dependent enzyme n=1 Tax=Nesterenkonia pannonica TaxID=1548602 RepID=UPI0021648A18|nr:aminotransferase class III-fold pyridoxal phosphate-dependent enzyme [Nesterenkonia pannonica]